MTPRQARRERREAERKAKKIEHKKARYSFAAVEAQTSSKHFPDIQPRWNPELNGQPSCAGSTFQTDSGEFAKPQRRALPGSYPEDEFPREEQIRNNAIADRISLQAGLPIAPPGPSPRPFSSLEEMREHYRAVGERRAPSASPAEPINRPAEIGFVSQNSPRRRSRRVRLPPRRSPRRLSTGR